MKSSAKREYLSLLKCIFFLFPMFFLIPQTAWQASQILFTIFREAFKLFDRNRDGFIDTRELKKVIATGWQLSIWLMLVIQVTGMLGTMLTKEELEEFMREADVVSSTYFARIMCDKIIWKDGNGKLDYDEFVKMLLSTPEDKSWSIDYLCFILRPFH